MWSISFLCPHLKSDGNSTYIIRILQGLTLTHVNFLQQCLTCDDNILMSVIIISEYWQFRFLKYKYMQGFLPSLINLFILKTPPDLFCLYSSPEYECLLHVQITLNSPNFEYSWRTLKGLKGIIICHFSESCIWLLCSIKYPDAQVRVKLMA